MASESQIEQPTQRSHELEVKAKALQEKLSKLKIPVRWKDGRVEMKDLKFNDRYVDEYTNATLPHELICDAIADEVLYFCNNVLVGVPMEEAMADKGGHIVGGRWVLCNKQDTCNPKMQREIRGPGGERWWRSKLCSLCCYTSVRMQAGTLHFVGPRTSAEWQGSQDPLLRCAKGILQWCASSAHLCEVA